MTSLTAAYDAVASSAADALIVGIGPDGTVTPHPQLADGPRAALDKAFAALEASGKLGSTTVIPGGDVVNATRVVGVGIGEGDLISLREAAGAASRACGKSPAKVVVALPCEDDGAAVAITHGVALGSYRFTSYKSESESVETEWLIAGASDVAVERG